jgi:lipoate synthase
LPVVRYVPPEEFDFLGRAAKQMGFAEVASGPFVRSSYHARDMAESSQGAVAVDVSSIDASFAPATHEHA